MGDELRALLERLLAGARDPDRAAPVLGRAASSQQPQQLVEFARALASAKPIPEDPAAESARVTVLDQVERALARADSLPAIAALLDVLALPRLPGAATLSPDARVHRAASILASSQREELFAGALARHAQAQEHRDLFACWAHELVVRGHDLSGHGAVRAMLRDLRGEGHPLGALPVAPIDLESTLRGWVPRVHTAAEAILSPLRPPRGSKTPPLRLAARADHRPFSLEPLDDPDRAERIREAVRCWTENSSGRVEARVFKTGRPVLEGDLGPVLSALAARGWDVFAGADEEALVARIIEPERALSLLFAAAANGGRYGGGVGGAYGRVFAWRSLAALAGAPPSAPAPALPAIARRRLWVEIDTGLPWFEQAGWDLFMGAVATDPGAPLDTAVALLAATDGD